MNSNELLVAAAVHLVVFLLAAAVIHGFGVGEPSIALVVAAVAGSQAAGYQYHRREPDPASWGVKAYVGGVLAVAAIAEGTASHAALGWMDLPEVVVPIGALGTFVFPFALFGSMQKAFAGKQ